MTTPLILFKNNAVSTIASPLSPLTTSITVAAGEGANFPSPTTGQQTFYATLIDAATGGINEIVLVTARSGDTMTVVRGVDGSTALSWIAGDTLAMLVNALAPPKGG